MAAVSGVFSASYNQCQAYDVGPSLCESQYESSSVCLCVCLLDSCTHTHTHQQLLMLHFLATWNHHTAGQTLPHTLLRMMIGKHPSCNRSSEVPSLQLEADSSEIPPCAPHLPIKLRRLAPTLPQTSSSVAHPLFSSPHSYPFSSLLCFIPIHPWSKRSWPYMKQGDCRGLYPPYPRRKPTKTQN